MNEKAGKPFFEGDILVCEDNIMIQELISDRLAKLGLKTTIAENGLKGVEEVKARIKNGVKPFALIFMDIFMPVMNGFEAAIEINELNTGTNIIAMTANDIPAERVQYATHGMLDYLKKPFTPQELLDCLMKYIKPVNPDGSNNPVMQDEEKLKIKLINNFVKNNKNIYNEIAKAIEDGNIKLAHRLAHTLKGSAGMFSKTKLQKAAWEAEKLLQNEENNINESALNVLKTELNIVLDEFTPLVTEDFNIEIKQGIAAVSLGPLSGDNKKIQEVNPAVLFAELEIMLDGGDTECLRLTDSLRSIQGIGEPLVRELIRQIEYFEFDNAMETLVQLKKYIQENKGG